MNPNSADELVRFANSKKKESKQTVSDINNSDALLNALGLKKKDTGVSATSSPVSETTSTTDLANTGGIPAQESSAPLGLGNAGQPAATGSQPVVGSPVDLSNNFQQDDGAVYGTIGGKQIDLRQAGPQNVPEAARKFEATMLQQRLQNKTLTAGDAVLLGGVTGLAPHEVNLAVQQPEKFKKYSEITNRINNAESKLDDMDYLAKNFPEYTKNLIKSIAPDLATKTDLNGETLSVFNDRLNEYAQAKQNEKRFGENSQQDIYIKQALNKQGIDPNKLLDQPYAEKVRGGIAAQKDSALSLLERKYPMPVSIGGAMSNNPNTQRTPEKQKAYNEERAVIENRYNQVNQALGISAANDYAKKNPAATPIEIGLEYLKVADPDKYKLIQKSQEGPQDAANAGQAAADAALGRKPLPFVTRSNTSLDRDLAQIGVNALYATGDEGLMKLANGDEKSLDRLYPEKKTADIYRRIGAELYKGQNLIANITPSLNRIDEAAKKALSEQDYQHYQEFVRPIEEKSIGTQIPMSGAANKLIEAVGTAGDQFANFLSDKFVPAALGGRTEKDQALDQLQQGDNTRMEDVGEGGANKSELAQLVAKEKKGPLSPQEQARKKDLQTYTDVRSTATKFIDGTAGITGQVIFQGLLTKGLGSVAAGATKAVGLLKAEQLAAGLATEETIANTATNFGISRDAIQTAAANLTAFGVSYDQAARQALELFPDDKDAGKRALHANTVALINMASENIFRDDKALDVFRREISPNIANLVNRLSVENLSKQAFKKEVTAIIKGGLELGGNILKENLKETAEEVATSLGTSVTTAVLAPAKFNAKDAYDDAVNTATTMFTNGFLVAGMAGVKHARVNYAGIPLLSQLGVNQQFTSGVINEINRQNIKGVISQDEAAEKMRVVNDAIQINKNEMQQADAKDLSEKARGKYFVKLLHEKELERQTVRSTDPVQQQELAAEAQQSQEVRQGILDGTVTVDEDYVPTPAPSPGEAVEEPPNTTNESTQKQIPVEAGATTDNIQANEQVQSQEIQILQAESDDLINKGVEQFTFRREQLKKEGKSRDEIAAITKQEWLATPDGKRYQEIEDKINSKPTQTQPAASENVTATTPASIIIWDTLVKKGIAEKVGENTYRFLPSANQQTIDNESNKEAAQDVSQATNATGVNAAVSSESENGGADQQLLARIPDANVVLGGIDPEYSAQQINPPPAPAASAPSYTEKPVTVQNVKNLKKGDELYQEDGKKFTVKKIEGNRIITNEGLMGYVGFLNLSTREPNPVLAPGDSRIETQPTPTDEAQQTPQENSQTQVSPTVLADSEAQAVVDDSSKDKKQEAGDELTVRSENADLSREILDENPDVISLLAKDNIHVAINEYEDGKITGEDLYKRMLANGLDKEYIIPALIEKLDEKPTPKKSFTKSAKEKADQFRKLKTKPPTITDADGNVINIQQAGIISWNDLVEAGAKAIELTGEIADGIRAAVEMMAETDWFRDMPAKEKLNIIRQVEDYFTAEINATDSNTEGGEEVAAEGREMIGITHEQTNEIAEELGFDAYQQKPETIAAWDAEAEDKIKAGYDAEALLNRMNDGHSPSAVEQRIVAKYIATLKNAVNINPSNENLTKLKRAIEISDVAGGREVAKSLVARKGYQAVDDSLAGYFIAEMESAQVDELTDAQKELVRKEHEEIMAANAALAAKIATLEEEKSRMEAEGVVSNETKRKNKGRKTDETFKNERKTIVESIREKLRQARTETNAVPIPYLKELIYIAPDVAKLTKNLIEQGVTKLADIIDSIHETLSPEIDGITKNDVQDLIAGKYNEKKKTRNQLAQQLQDIKLEAVLLNKLENLVNGTQPKTEKEKVQRNQQITDLQNRIKNFQKLQSDAEAAKRRVAELEAELERVRNRQPDPPATPDPVQRRVPTDEETALEAAIKAEREAWGNELKKTPQQIALQSRKTRLTNQIAEIEEQIRTSNYDTPVPVAPLVLDREGQELQDRLIRLKTEREVRLLRQEYEQRSKAQKAIDQVLRVANIPRSLMSSMDYSAPLRQAVIATIGHPTLAAKASVEMFKASFSQKNFDRWFYELKASPRYALMQETGLALTDPHDPKLSVQEEAYMGNLAEKIPLIGRLVAGSERAYVLYLNKMRADVFNRFVDRFEYQGKTYENNQKLYEQTASYVNNITGRGDISGLLEKASPVLNSLLFSPRLIASRLNLLNPIYFAKLPNELKVAYAKDMGLFIATGLTILGLAYMAGKNCEGDDKDCITVENDPRSSDFGKIKAGNTRWDIWGGFQPYVRVFSQLLTGEKKATTDGKITKLDGDGAFGQNRGDVLFSFVRGKLAPVPSIAVNFLVGKTVTGEDVTVLNQTVGAISPLIIPSLIDAYKDQGVKGLFTVGVPSTFGVGAATYEPRESTKSKIKIYVNGDKRDTTPEEYEKYSNLKSAEKIKLLEHYQQKGVPLNKYKEVTTTETEDNKIKKYDDLTPEEKKRLDGLISRKAANAVKKKLNWDERTDDE